MILLLIKVFKVMAGVLTCPKCAGFSRIDVEDNVPVHRCVMCGYRKYLEVHDNGMVTSHKPQNINRVALPSSGSQLSKILGCLVVMGNMTSSSVADRLGVSTNKATTNLSVLRARGLIRVIENRKGHSGGSLWEVDEAVRIKFLGVN